MMTVQVLVTEAEPGQLIEQQALDLGRLHVDRPLQVVVAPEIEGVGPLRHRAGAERGSSGSRSR